MPLFACIYLFGLFLAIGFGSAATAQESAKPLSLVPQPSTEASPSADSGRPTDLSERVTPSSNTDKVSVSRLKAIDPSSVGILSESNGGFDLGIWDHSERAAIESLVSMLPSSINSPYTRNLFTRLLLTEARVPEGQGNPLALLQLRAAKLAEAGYISLAAMLGELAPPGNSERVLDELFVADRLLEGDNQGACERVETIVADGASSSVWLKYLSLCRVFTGELDAARLAADLVRELSPEDGAFFSLAAFLSDGGDARLVELSSPTALHLAMVRVARLHLPENLAADVHPSLLRSIALSPNASPSLRLHAAEKAEALGLLGTERLAQLYSSIFFSDEEADKVFQADADFEGISAQALLYQLSQTQEVPAAKAEVLRQALDLARENGAFATAARVNLAILSSIEPTPDLLWFATDAGAALFAAGADAMAKRWFDIAHNSVSTGDTSSAETVLDLWPSIQIATDINMPWVEPAVLPWVTGMLTRNNAGTVARVEATLMIFEALGFSVPDSAWMQLLVHGATSQPAAPPPALIRGFDKAIAFDRLGEALLYALLILSNNEDNRKSGAVVAPIVEGFLKIGLENEARALASEVLNAYIIPDVVAGNHGAVGSVGLEVNAEDEDESYGEGSSESSSPTEIDPTVGTE